MATKRRKRKTSQPEYTFLAISIDDYDVRTHAGINNHLNPPMQYFLDDDDPVYSFDTDLEITGICTYPEDRVKDRYFISLRSSSIMPRDLRLKVKDLRKRDKNGGLMTRKYRGHVQPVYEDASPIAYLERIRGEPRWSVWVQVAPQMITDSLLILSSGKPAYVSIHERKENRQRKIQGLSIQTTDPVDE